jgi:hypothetical protein
MELVEGLICVRCLETRGEQHHPDCPIVYEGPDPAMYEEGFAAGRNVGSRSVSRFMDAKWRAVLLLAEASGADVSVVRSLAEADGLL